MNRPKFSFFGTAFALCFVSMRIGAAPRSITELTPLATIGLGKTADWVAITADAVWVASTGPFAVHRIDPKSNTRVASVALPGEPCAGLATGFGSLWVPLCTAPASLAKVNLKTNRLEAIFMVGPAAPEGGVTYGAGSVWLITDKTGVLARINPANGAIVSVFHVPPGSFNPAFSGTTVWVTRAEASELTGYRCRHGSNHRNDRDRAQPTFSRRGPRRDLDPQSRRRHVEPRRCTKQTRCHHFARDTGSWRRHRLQRRQRMDQHAQGTALAH